MHARELVIVGCLAAGAADLLDAWAHDPYVRVGAPLAVVWALAVRHARATLPPARWRVTALVLAALARAVDVHALAHLALAAWLCAPAVARWPLLAAAGGWSPALGHVVTPASPLIANVARVLLCAAALAAARREGERHATPA